MMNTTIPQYAAQIASGDGDARHATDADVGELHHRDVAFSVAATSPSKLRHAVTANRGERKRSTYGIEQREKATLRAEIFDALALSETVVDDAGVRVRQLASRSSDAAAEAKARVQEFDRRYVYSHQVGFTVSRLLSEAGVTIDLDFQKRYGSPIATPDTAKYLSVFKELSSAPLLPSQVEALRQRLKTHVSRGCFPWGDEGLPELLASTNRLVMRDAVAEVTSDISKLQAEVEALTGDIAALQEEISHAKSREDYATVDALDQQMLDAARSRFEASARAVSLVASAKERASATPSAASSPRATEAHIDIDNLGMEMVLQYLENVPMIPSLRREKQQLAERLSADGRRMDEFMAARHRADLQAVADYDGAVKLSLEALDVNAHMQSKVWQDIEESVARLSTLRAEAHAVTEKHVRLTETEQKRRQEHREFQASFATHRQYLDDLGHNTTVALSFLDDSDVFLGRCRDKVATSGLGDKISALVAERRNSLAGAYGFLARCGNRRAHAVDMKVANCARQEAELLFQQNSADTTHDENRVAYKEQAALLAGKRAALAGQRHTLQDLLETTQAKYLRLTGLDGDADGVLDNPTEGPLTRPVLEALQLRVKLRDQFSTALESLVADYRGEDQNMREQVAAIVSCVSTRRGQLQQRRSEQRADTAPQAAFPAKEM